MARGIVGKLIRGAAASGVPMLQEEHRAQIQTRRDDALNKIQQQYRKEDQAIRATERTEDRADRAREFDASQGNEARRIDIAEQGLDLQGQGVEMQREQLDLTAQQIAQTLEASELGIVEQRRLQGLYDIIANPEAQQDEITRAITVLNGLKGQNPEKYQAITLYDEEVDEFGNQRRSSGVLNQSTGQITPASGRDSAPTSSFDDLPDPSSYSGRTIEDEDTGKRFRSNGTEWVEL